MAEAQHANGPALHGPAGGGEAAGPLWPPAELDEDALGACRSAAAAAYAEAGAGPADIDFWGLYVRPP